MQRENYQTNQNFDYPSKEIVLGNSKPDEQQQMLENVKPFGLDINNNQDNYAQNLAQPLIIYKTIPNNYSSSYCQYCGQYVIPKKNVKSSCVTHLAAGTVCLLSSVCCLCCCITPIIYTNHCFETSNYKCPNCKRVIDK